MMKDQSVRDSVREILESAQESDRQLPSICAIRAKTRIQIEHDEEIHVREAADEAVAVP